MKTNGFEGVKRVYETVSRGAEEQKVKGKQKREVEAEQEAVNEIRG